MCGSLGIEQVGCVKALRGRTATAAKGEGNDVSMVHNVEIGYFGRQGEAKNKTALSADECHRLLKAFNDVSKAEYDVEVQDEPRQMWHSCWLIGSCEGQEVCVRNGSLFCPYFSTQYNLSSICYAICAASIFGCSIFFDRFVTPDELWPRESLSTDFQRYIQSCANALL